MEAAPAGKFDVERVRFSGERDAASGMRGDVWLQDLILAAESRGAPDATRVRRQLLARSLRLTEGMAPDAWSAARAAAEALGVERSLEIYQAAGAENAAIHLVDQPVLLEIRGRLLSLLDQPSTIAVFGHELGHWLAHGPSSPDGPLGMVVGAALELPNVPEHARERASKLSMAREITADRFGLLACGGLDPALRLEMAATTGLSAGELTWDTAAYLEQCKALIEQMDESGDTARGVTHPEHGLRAWAMWLFSESDVYLELTTQGPGTRPIDEVNEAINKVLGASPTEGLTNSALMLDPIPEVHECALASAALVALADNELSEEEALAIEGVFAHLVEDWQRYLDYDNALEAFSDTAWVVIHGGVSQQRAVFQVLIHVLAADGKVEPSEINMICSIGDALRCGTLYRAMLTPVLKTLGEEVPELSAEVRPIAMPARSDEAEAALEIFLKGVVRRRGGEASPRRLYRLLGDTEGTEKSREIIARLLTTVGVALDEDVVLAETELDRRLTLTPTADALAAQTASETPEPDTATEPDRVRLAAALTRLRDLLVSGDGRSPSIRLRKCRTGRSFDLHELEYLSVGHAERTLTLARARSRARIVDGKEIGVHDGAERVSAELVALEREALSRLESTGARDLYLGAPFLTGVFYGYLVRAPLILHPVALSRTSGRGFEMVARDEDPPIANQALIRLLFGKKGIQFPDELGEQLDTAAVDGIEAVQALLGDHGIVARPEKETLQPLAARDEAFATWPNGRVVIEPCAVLGFFPQSSSDMIQDYDELLAAIADTDTPVGDRFGAAGALLPADLRKAFGITPYGDEVDQALIPVVLADPSQRAVLMQARQRRTLVVDGPPGTGKSQVIVNLVADALARGHSVAVVCEKRAALDVVAQRLEQVGLRHLLAVVHDVYDDRRGLYDQVVARLNEGSLRDHDEVATARTVERLADVRAQLEERRSALARSLGDAAPSLGQLHLLGASYDATALTDMDPGMARLSFMDVRRLSERLGREARNRDLYEAGSVWRPPKGQARPSLAALSPDELISVEEGLRSARDTAAPLDALRAEQAPVAVAPVRAGADALRAALETASDRSDPAGRAAFAAWVRLHDDPNAEGLVARLEQTWSDAETWLQTMPEPAAFDGSPELTSAMFVARQKSGSWLRWFSLAWWKARGFIKRFLLAQWPAASASAVNPALLTRVDQRQAGAVGWKVLQSVHQATGLSPILPDAPSARAHVERLLATWRASRPVVAARTALVAAGAWPEPEQLADWDVLLKARLTLVEAAETHAAAFAEARTWLPWQSETPDAETVGALHEAWSLDSARAARADRNLDTAAVVHADARALVLSLADGGLRREAEWTDSVEHGWANLAIKAVERRHPAIRVLDTSSADEVEKHEEQLRALIRERGEHQVSSILARCDRVSLLTEARPDKGSRRTPLQKAREQMLREASKRRYVLSLRGFVRQFAGDGLLELLPVWLVSPETMAILFPGKPVFELVVMDEASQATVEKGLPALVRGRRAVIAGDEKQMPPSQFFELRAGDEDTVGTEETVEQDALSAESLLVLARERCVHEGLRWHYRCLHEELIAFSNHAMYGGELATIPSTATPSAPSALRWVDVPDGAYDKGVNPIEAMRVVDLIGELLAREPAPSIGVVTFNVQQRRVILDSLDARADSDPDFGSRWAEARAHDALDHRPFVKSIEAVQGDERDVIIFSLGHAPVERKSGPLKGQLYVPARFGPLGRAGGERRLNVAVSRAKRECIVVSSFSPNLLSVASTRHEGPKLLKAFLEFAWDMSRGRRRQADKTLERVRRGSLGAIKAGTRAPNLGAPPLAAQIGLAMEKHGIGFDLGVGSSGFQVPLALRDPDRPSSWRLAVLTDDGVGIGGVDEHHHHIPGVLRARGWAVERVDTRSWHRGPEAIVDRLVAALKEAVVAERDREARALEAAEKAATARAARLLKQQQQAAEERAAEERAAEEAPTTVEAAPPAAEAVPTEEPAPAPWLDLSK